MTVTFFGNGFTPKRIKKKLRETIIDLIICQGADCFIVSEGHFDNVAAKILMELQERYPYFKYIAVFADFSGDTGKTQRALKKAETDYCNKYKIDNADIVISYITHNWGRAAKLVALAKRMEKQTIGL